MNNETVIKWYDPGTFAQRPVGWYVEQSDEIECDIVSNNNLGIHYGWVLTKLNKTDDKEVYFKTFLHVTLLGYREFWKHNNETNIATRHIQYAVVTPYTLHKTLPFVVLETSSYYAPVLFRELQRTKRLLDFFQESKNAWQELVNDLEQVNTFYSNKIQIWSYKFTLEVKKSWTSFYEQKPVLTRVPILEIAYVPRVTHYSYANKNEATSYEQAALVAAQHGFLTEFPREYGIGVVDFQKTDWCKFACAFD